MLDQSANEFYFPFEKILLLYQEARGNGEAGSAILEGVVSQESFSLFLKYPKDFLYKLVHITLFPWPDLKL